MLPIVLDLSRLPVALVGGGAALLRRLAQLDAHGATDLRVFAADPQPDIAAAAGPRLFAALPKPADLVATRLMFIAGLDPTRAAAIANFARAMGILVHVEDRPDISAVHMPAIVRRGDLLIAASTGGQAPGLAARLGRHLAAAFGPEWADRLRRTASLRARWRAAGLEHDEIGRRLDALIERDGWLPRADRPPAPPARRSREYPRGLAGAP
jgi:precorrin-2 dehydrogenase/sirohydrochlorin ferrochelatase